MPSNTITYQKTHTFKYKIVRPSQHETGIKVACKGRGGYAELTRGGLLLIRAGYRLDGPSGPTIDSKNFMAGSLVHDALYQFMREGDLSTSYRKQADQLLRTMCRDDGMWWIRAQWVYVGVRMGGAKSARPRPEAEIETAPD